MSQSTLDVVDERPELRLSGPAGAGIGVILATLLLAPLPFFSQLAGMQFLAVALSFAAAVYFGFAVADGRVMPLLVEFLVAGAFLFAAAAALWANSPPALAGGYLAHAAWDSVHHPRAVDTTVRNWYPPFCVAFDVVVAAFILAWLPSGGVG